MKPLDLRPFFNAHCKFRLKSGKEVYGVVWEVDASGDLKHYFTSYSNYDLVSQDTCQPLSTAELADQVDIEDFIQAERLVG